ncbi:hypothetical protein PHYPSEUDO_013930 [Phytophthora pseudosyringae]|uniref:Uncharacterized protein n=1 Tax=Phytophthora pseudosyringae TaxID=221518 RepID=A0A8T1V7H5_9STRA|nr:hypothetical protein PHYPSEUDO_013930 [Phytophthora pseudosyringae]
MNEGVQSMGDCIDCSTLYRGPQGYRGNDITMENGGGYPCDKDQYGNARDADTDAWLREYLSEVRGPTNNQVNDNTTPSWQHLYSVHSCPASTRFVAPRPKLQLSSSCGVIPTQDLSLAATVEQLTQELLEQLCRRCAGPYAAFAGVVNRLRVLSKLLLEGDDLHALVRAEEAIVNLLHQLNRSHLLRATDVASHLRGVRDAVGRSQLAYVAHECVDDLNRVFMPTQEAAGVDWREEWQADCALQFQLLDKLLGTGTLQHGAEEMTPRDRSEVLRDLQCVSKSDVVVECALIQEVAALLERLAGEPEPELERWLSLFRSDLLALAPWQRHRATAGARRTKEHKEYIPAHEIDLHTSWLYHGKDDSSESSSSSLIVGSWLDTAVAIQLVDTSSDGEERGDEAGETFDREVCAWFRLDHPNVLKVFGGCDDT